MAQLMETIERTGSGFTIYYYPAGNPHAKQEVREVAESQTKSNIILMPRLEGAPNAYGLERIEPSATSINSLQQIVHDFFELQIKRFILGQTLSSEPHATGLGCLRTYAHNRSLRGPLPKALFLGIFALLCPILAGPFEQRRGAGRLVMDKVPSDNYYRSGVRSLLIAAWVIKESVRME